MVLNRKFAFKKDLMFALTALQFSNDIYKKVSRGYQKTTVITLPRLLNNYHNNAVFAITSAVKA